MLRNSIDSIRKIAQGFLDYSADKKSVIDNSYILVSQILSECIKQKEIQFSDKNIDFQYSFDPSLTFTFIYGNAINFERMINNILNNSVEAIEQKQGIIKMEFSVDGTNIKITIQDNGQGMSPETVEKLVRNESVSTTKLGGFGIGTTQIRNTLKELNGSQFIESIPNVSTTITLIIPKANKPKWAIEQIDFIKNDVLVILDDDVLVHSLWKSRLEQYLPNIALKFFEKGLDAVDFIKSHEEKYNILFLVDYELRNQKLNGFDVIEKCDIRQHQVILVSSIYNHKEIQDQAIKLGIKILPKTLINSVRLTIDGKKDNTLSFVDADVVVLDNEGYFANLISDFLKDNGFVVDTYYDPLDFLQNLSKYNINTKIITDNYFDSNTTCDAFVAQLSKKGFTDVCVLSGLIENSLCSKYPEGTKFILKGEENFKNHLMCWCKK